MRTTDFQHPDEPEAARLSSHPAKHLYYVQNSWTVCTEIGRSYKYQRSGWYKTKKENTVHYEQCLHNSSLLDCPNIHSSRPEQNLRTRPVTTDVSWQRVWSLKHSNVCGAARLRYSHPRNIKTLRSSSSFIPVQRRPPVSRAGTEGEPGRLHNTEPLTHTHHGTNICLDAPKTE